MTYGNYFLKLVVCYWMDWWQEMDNIMKQKIKVCFNDPYLSFKTSSAT